MWKNFYNLFTIVVMNDQFFPNLIIHLICFVLFKKLKDVPIKDYNENMTKLAPFNLF